MFTSGMSSDVDFSNWNPMSINSPLSVMRPADTLAVRIWALKTEGVAANADKLSDISAAVLILMVFVFSLASRHIGARLENRLTGGKGGK